MLETLRNAFKIKDIRKKLLYTFMMLVVVRLGSQLPVPGVNRDYFTNWFASQQANGALNFFSAHNGHCLCLNAGAAQDIYDCESFDLFKPICEKYTNFLHFLYLLLFYAYTLFFQFSRPTGQMQCAPALLPGKFLKAVQKIFRYRAGKLHVELHCDIFYNLYT